MIIGSMCTIPERHDSFLHVIKQIVLQQTLPINVLHVWLNGYKNIPSDFPDDDFFIYHIEQINKGPWIRYSIAREYDDNDILITMDDDLIYQNNYVKNGINKLTEFDDKTSICFGGVYWDYVVPIDQLEYYKYKHLINYSTCLEIDIQVPVLLGGVGFHKVRNIKDITFPTKKIFFTNDDLWISADLQRNGCKIICASKPENWIRENDSQNSPNALWKRDQANRKKAFKEIIQRYRFVPYKPDDVKIQKGIPVSLIIMNGKLSGDIIDSLIMKPSIHAQHILEILHYKNHYSEPHSNLKIHYILYPSIKGRLSWFKPISKWRKNRVKKIIKIQVLKYLEWIKNITDIQEIKILGQKNWIEEIIYQCINYLELGTKKSA